MSSCFTRAFNESQHVFGVLLRKFNLLLESNGNDHRYNDVDGADDDGDRNLFWRAFWEEGVNIVSSLDEVEPSWPAGAPLGACHGSPPSIAGLLFKTLPSWPAS